MRLCEKLVAAACAALALSAGLASGAGASASPNAAPAPRAALLTGFSCRTGASALRRQIAVTAVMRPLHAPQRLAVRPVLIRRNVRNVRAVRGGRLDRWITPDDPTIGERPQDVWKVRLPVAGLTAAARYRLQVTFRWSDAKGRPVASQTERTAACYQP